MPERMVSRRTGQKVATLRTSGKLEGPAFGGRAQISPGKVNRQDTETVMQNMSEEGAGIPRDFVLKQIENEIEAARRALRMSPPVEAERDEDGSEAEQVRALTQRIVELREAVDALAARARR